MSVYSLPSNTSEAIFVKMFALIDVVLDTVGNDLVAKEAPGRMVCVAAFALKRAVRFGVEALAG